MGAAVPSIFDRWFQYRDGDFWKMTIGSIVGENGQAKQHTSGIWKGCTAQNEQFWILPECVLLVKTKNKNCGERITEYYIVYKTGSAHWLTREEWWNIMDSLTNKL